MTQSPDRTMILIGSPERITDHKGNTWGISDRGQVIFNEEVVEGSKWVVHMHYDHNTGFVWMPVLRPIDHIKEFKGVWPDFIE